MQHTLKKQQRGSHGLQRVKSTGHGQGQPETQPNLQRYSYIYNDLVEGPQDFIGLVAYSIYKQEKICHVRDFEASHGRPPDPKELKSFHDIARNRLDGYKEQAETRVNDFFEDIFKEHVETLDQLYQERLLDELKKSRTGWWKGIFQSIIGSVLFAILIGVIVICILYSQYGLGWIVQDILKTTIKP